MFICCFCQSMKFPVAFQGEFDHFISNRCSFLPSPFQLLIPYSFYLFSNKTGSSFPKQCQISTARVSILTSFFTQMNIHLAFDHLMGCQLWLRECTYPHVCGQAYILRMAHEYIRNAKYSNRQSQGETDYPFLTSPARILSNFYARTQVCANTQ